LRIINEGNRAISQETKFCASVKAGRVPDLIAC
jgi:hypothetical protein